VASVGMSSSASATFLVGQLSQTCAYASRMHIVTDARASFINDGSWRFIHGRAALLAALHAELGFGTRHPLRPHSPPAVKLTVC
jgi:hypothetical protein